MNGYQDPALSSAILGPAYTTGRGHPALGGGQAASRSGAASEHRKHVTRTSINTLTDTSQYHVEHLTTFVLDRKDGLVTVDDGVRRLRLLEAKGKVWTQELVLQVEEKSVSLLDPDTQKPLEAFPVSSVQRCQAVMDAGVFHSLLALVCRDPGQNKPDLHLFQCDHVKASLVQADIQSAVADAKGGKVRRRPEALRMILRSDGIIPPPPAAPAPEPPASIREDDGKQLRSADEDGVAVEMSHVDRDVQILNHLLDDIEFFVIRLQKAAEAFGALTERKKNKRDKKKKSPGEGVLTLRSKAPPPEDFVDCLQKFKHAFNQLGKLKDHIQNPSAEELLHFLFTPLRMVVQASGSVDLARSVLVPLLTREAIDLLHGSGTAEERHLWVTLGDGWTKCRLEWPKDHHFPPSSLTFRDGWEPPTLTASQEPSQLTERLLPVRRQEEATPRLPKVSGSGSGFSARSRSRSRSGSGSGQMFLPAHRNFSSSENLQVLEREAVGTDPERGGAASGVQAHLLARCKFDFEARNSTELTVLKDEVVQVSPNTLRTEKVQTSRRASPQVLDDSRQWWKVSSSRGASGYVPNNILEIREPAYSHTIQLMMPKTEFESLKQLLGELNQKQTKTCSDRAGPDVTPGPAGPTPPPPDPTPMPPAPPPDAEPARLVQDHNRESGDHGGVIMDQSQQDSTNCSKSTMDEVQDELLQRLTLGRSTNKKLPLLTGSSRTPTFSITYDSTPEDVRAWLEAKGFSPVTVSSLGVLTGAQLFSLNKEELRTVCPDDGARVFSQVTVQKAALEVFF